MKLKLLLIIVLALVLFSSSALAAVVDSTAGYWKLEEAASPYVDELGLSPFTSAAIPDRITGKIDFGQKFTVANLDVIQSSANYTNDFTLNFWQNFTGAELVGGSKWNQAAWAFATIDWYWESGNDYMLWTLSSGAGAFVFSCHDVVKPDAWHMITLTYNDTSNDAMIYINGTHCNTTNYPGLDNSAYDIYFGMHDVGAHKAGMVDEIGLWNRTLPPSDITPLWNGGLGFQYPFVPLAPQMDNTTWNFTTATANWTAWRTNQSFPIPTTDTTPTINVSTDSNAYCRIHTLDQNWTTMGITRNCTTTGGTEHVCSLPAADSLPTQGLDYLYIACIDSTLAEETSASTSGSLALFLTLNTTLQSGVLNESWLVDDLLVDEGENFRLWSNWTFNHNGSSITNATGNCTYSVDNIIEENYNLTIGTNTTVCTGVACTYDNRTTLFTGLNTHQTFVNDIYKFKLCHNGAVQSDFHVSTNCSGEIYNVDSGEIPLCSNGYAEFDIISKNCTGQDTVLMGIWSDGNTLNKALRLVDDMIGIDRVLNESNEVMMWNETLGLWHSDEHEFYEHGQKNFSMNCTDSAGVQNMTYDFFITIENAPPTIIINTAWWWLLTNPVVFSDNLAGKYPLSSTFNSTFIVIDHDSDSVITYLNFSNGTNIDTQMFTNGFFSVNYTSNNFTTNLTFLNGLDGYIFQVWANSTSGNLSTTQRAFTAENLAPVCSWTDGASLVIGSVPHTLLYSCVDDEGESVSSWIYVNSTLNETSIPSNGSFSFVGVEGFYNVTVFANDTFRNGSGTDIVLEFTSACGLVMSSPCDGCRYPDNELEFKIGCNNTVNITNCTYSINDFVTVELTSDQCLSGVNFTAERGWNNMFVVARTTIGNVNSTIDFWAKDHDATVFNFPVLWVLMLVMLACFVLGGRMGLFYIIGGFVGIIVGMQLIAFSVYLGIGFAILAPVVGIVLMWKN